MLENLMVKLYRVDKVITYTGQEVRKWLEEERTKELIDSVEGFPDHDSFFHKKLSEIIQEGVKLNLPWYTPRKIRTNVEQSLPDILYVQLEDTYYQRISDELESLQKEVFGDI